MDLMSNSDLIPNQKPVDKSHCKSLHFKKTYNVFLSFFLSLNPTFVVVS